MTYNPEVHHRQSIRLRDYDYSKVGAYFVTICAWQRECLFDEVGDGVMRFDDAGRIVDESWQQISTHFSGVDIDQCVIIPNHFHGIIVINAPTVGNIIRGFKARCTHEINQQRNRYDRIIRDESELHAVRQYIIDNPVKWNEDENHPTRL